MSVSHSTEVQLVVFLCSSIPVVLFYTSGISKCLNRLFLFSPHLCFIIGFICDLFVARNCSWMSYLDDLLNTDNIYFDQMVDRIYPTELLLNKANSSDTEAPFFLGFESMYI